MDYKEIQKILREEGRDDLLDKARPFSQGRNAKGWDEKTDRGEIIKALEQYKPQKAKAGAKKGRDFISELKSLLLGELIGKSPSEAKELISQAKSVADKALKELAESKQAELRVWEDLAK